MSLIATRILEPEKLREFMIPLCDTSVPGGHPEQISPDESGVDVYTYLVKNPDDTYGIFVQGDSMTTEDGVSIESGDLILVDRVVEPTSKSIVVAEVDGALTVKRVLKAGKKFLLLPTNKKFKPVEVNDSQSCERCGVVTFVVKRTY